VRRIVLLGHTGHITLDAVRWCADVGIGIVQVDTNGRLLMTTAPAGRHDARLRRAQAAATNAPVGLKIARGLLAAKIDGQAAVARQQLNNPTLATALTRLARSARKAPGLRDCRVIEAQASNLYFGGWPSRVACRFTEQDHAYVPEHWSYYAVRRSLITGASPRAATDPVNAMLNYSYALAEAECRLALHAVALDPGLGISHTDTKNRDSLALDLLEPLRPVVDRHILTLLDRRHFTRRDFHETPAGSCRLVPPLTHDLADAIPAYAAAVASLAEGVAHALARSSPGQITLTTPLSRANNVNTQVRGARSAHRTPATSRQGRRTCRVCGADLYGSARQLCPTCWPVARNEQMRQLGLARAKPKEATPSVEEFSGGWSLQQYREDIWPRLAKISLRDMERVTGLANSSCSQIRSGKQVPNPRHWPVLARLAGADVTRHEVSRDR
jgi:CRISPR-associated endonuclease Cas1